MRRWPVPRGREARPPKRKVARSLSELRDGWRQSAIRAFGACVVYRLAERARAAAAAVWARVRPVVDIALAAVDITAVVYVMRGAFKRHHLLAEARRHLAHTLRGRPHEPGLDEQIVQTVVDDYTRPAGRTMMTADLRALYPHDIEDQAVIRPLTRARSAPRYEKVRLAAGALTARVHAVRRSHRLNSRSLPHTVAVPAGPPPRSRRDRSEARAGRAARKAVRDQEQMTDVATVEESRRMIEAAAAQMAATLQDGIRERAAAPGPRPQPAPHPAARNPVRAGPGHTHRRSQVTTPPNDPIEAALALVRQGAQERATVLGPPHWQPIWKKPRKRLTKAEKKKRLHLQRQRLQQAGHRRFYAGQSRRPRPRRNRIGSAASRRGARALSRLRHSNASLW